MLPHPLIVVGAPPPAPQFLNIVGGMVRVASHALFTAGAHVFLPPLGALGPHVERWPQTLGGARGALLGHDGWTFAPGEPVDPAAMMALDLTAHRRGFRTSGVFLLGDAPALARVSTGGRGETLRQLVHLILQLSEHLGLSFPPDIGWRDLLGARTIPTAWEALEALGAQMNGPATEPANEDPRRH